MSLLISFTVVCVAIFIVNTSEEEMVKTFAAIIAMLSIVLSIVLAPWFLQLLILILVLLWEFRLHNHSGYSKD